MLYFVTVAEELHFGRAAARLNVVQPAISQQVGLLEKELGTHLIDRTSRRVSLTEAGKVYLVEARRALQQIDLATQAAREAAGGLTGSLSVGFVDNAIWLSLPQSIREYRRRYPGIALSLIQMPRSQQLTALQNGQLDVAILPGPANLRGIMLHEFARARLYVALPNDHPLCALDKVDITALAKEPLIALPSVDDPKRINEIINQMCVAAGFAPIMGQPVQQMLTGLSLVAAGLGVSIVPGWLRTAWTKNVEYRPLTPNTDYVLLLAYREDNARTAVRHLVSLTRDFITRSSDTPRTAIGDHHGATDATGKSQ